MAKYIGKALSGTVLAFCTILILSPQSWAQQGRPVTRTISGNVGLPGVKMQVQGLSTSVETGDDGAYSVQVNFGWSGTITPMKPGYTFEPSNRKYTAVKTDVNDGNFMATAVKITVSGSVGIPGVKMVGLPDEPNSGPDGRYTATVPYGFNGVVTPEKAGYTFEPASKAYDQVTANQTQSYKPVEITFTISGTVTCSLGDANGIVLKGLPGDPKLGPKGTYSVKVPYGWHQKVTPQREGCKFTPDGMDYPPVLSDLSDQDYTATVDEFTLAGSVGVADVVLQGLPNDPTSDASGSFSVKVPFGYSGKITPTLKGYDFNPPSMSIARVTSERSGLTFQASIKKLTIAGTISGPPAVIGGVKMDGLPGDVVTNAQGAYSAKVDFGFSNTVTPTKEGVSFTDPSKTYNGLETDQPRENYTAKAVTYTVSGNVGQGGVQVLFSGTGKVATSEADGSYKIEMPYHWSGTITPKKAGFSFDPASIKCEQLTESKVQDFQSSPIMYTIGGKVTSLEAGPVADASITIESATGGSGSTMTQTDAEGQYHVSVGYGWKGNIFVAKDGVVFEKNTRSIETPVTRDMLDQHFTGKVKMLTITKKVQSADGQPIEGVAITATPGIGKATSNAQGKYTISVPFGWTGVLKASKEGWEFPDVQYEVPLTADIDEVGGPKPPATTPTTPTTDTQPTPPAVTPKPGDTQPTPPAVTPKPGDTQPKITPQGPKTPADPERERILQMLREAGIDITKISKTDGGPVEPAPVGVPLLDAISRIAMKTGAKIAVDATVKNTPVPVTGDVTTLPALLSGTPYKTKQQGDTILVYKSITNNFSGEQLPAALETLSTLADVTITMDEKVAGVVSVNLVDVTLEQALDRLVGGSQFGWVKRTDKTGESYYVVTSSLPKDAGFMMLSVQRAIYLNNIAPTKAAELMGPSYQEYVRGGTDPNSHWLTVTAPAEVADKIIAQVKALDHSLRQVLLTARVVSMEKGTNLNVGMEWQTPRASLGFFRDSFVDGADSVSTSAWPWGIQVGYSPDRTFTDALTAQLNLLQRDGRAEIVSSPQVMASDGQRSMIRDIQEEWYMMSATTAGAFMYTQSELQKIESGTILSITPRIGDDNDIRLEMAVEVSDSTPQGTSSGLPVVTRRQAQSNVRIPDGGTAAVSGLTENRSKTLDRKVPFFGDLPLVGSLFRNNSVDKSSREIAVFVTANIAPEGGSLTTAAPENTFSQAPAAAAPAAGDSFNDQLQRELAGQPR